MIPSINRLHEILDTGKPTPKQHEAISAYIASEGKVRAAARSLDIHHSSLQARLRAADSAYNRQNTGIPSPEGFEVSRIHTDGKGKYKGAKHVPVSTDEQELPPHFAMHALTVNTRGDGSLSQQWTKYSAKQVEMWALFEKSVGEFVAKYENYIPPASTLGGKPYLKQAALFCLGDMHVGLYATAAETGQAMDLQTIIDIGRAAVDKLVDDTPACEVAYLMEVGDFFHAHDGENRTKASGHSLDVSGRFHEVMEAGHSLLVYMVESLLRKFPKVVVAMAQGNHDEQVLVTATAAFLRAMFRADDRVEIAPCEAIMQTFVYGKNLIGLTHGHTVKMEATPSVMPVVGKDVWSSIRYCFVVSGHIHHRRVFEDKGVVVETFNTLNTPDAWHASRMYLNAGRSFTCVRLREEGGECGRSTVSVLPSGEVI